MMVASTWWSWWPRSRRYLSPSTVAAPRPSAPSTDRPLSPTHRLSTWGVCGTTPSSLTSSDLWQMDPWKWLTLNWVSPPLLSSVHPPLCPDALSLSLSLLRSCTGSGLPGQVGVAALRQGPGHNGTSFHGCIRNLYINGELQDLTQFLLQSGVLPGCQPCSRPQCAHGTCHPTGQSSFSCECEPGWTGQLCDQQVNNPCDGNKSVPQPTSPTFTIQVPTFSFILFYI